MIGTNGALALPMSGSLPPDLQGTLFRAGPAWPWGAGEEGQAAGALHAVELRDGRAVSYVRQESDADASVFWHADRSWRFLKRESRPSIRASWSRRSSPAG